MQDDIVSETASTDETTTQPVQLKEVGQDFLIAVFCLFTTMVLAFALKPTYFFFTWTIGNSQNARGATQALHMGLVPLSVVMLAITAVCALFGAVATVCCFGLIGAKLWNYDGDQPNRQ